MRLLSDIRAYRELDSVNKIRLQAFLIALSGALSAIDFYIPKPLPFAKIGIANCVTLIVLLENQFGLAMSVAFFRTLVAALMLGTFLSYSYLLSVSGAVFSTAMTWITIRFFGKRLSPIGISVWSAFFHTAAQCGVVSLFYGWDRGMLAMFSGFLLFSLLTGTAIGLIVSYFYRENADGYIK